jgi:hypothetical protein
MPKLMPKAIDPTALVVTSIAAPTPPMVALADGVRRAGWSFVCVGDTKTPADWSLSGCDFLSIADQRQGAFATGQAVPDRHYARKNLGYLWAIARGARRIVETDDDNSPLPRFWDAAAPEVSGRLVSAAGWINAFAAFTDFPIWPRGLPLEAITEATLRARSAGSTTEGAFCPVQQSLANGDSDVDAVYRMTRGDLLEFRVDSPLVLDIGAWCPFNSQSTTWFPEAFDLLYLPAHCSFRMTDIWRSFVVQRCLWAQGWRLAYRQASVHQDRNPHDLLKDFEAEVQGYLYNSEIVRRLGALTLEGGRSALRKHMHACYRVLVDMGLVGAAELELIELWFSDLDLARAGVGA